MKFGRSIGFPTANLPVKRRRVPLTGVFAVRVNGILTPGATLFVKHGRRARPPSWAPAHRRQSYAL